MGINSKFARTVSYQEGYANSKLTLKAVHEAADPLKIAVVETPIHSTEHLIGEVRRLAAGGHPGFEAIAISPDPTIQSEESMAALMAFARDHKLVVVANAPDQVRKGALMTYSDDTFELGRLAASLADKIFKGAKPGVIPVAFIEPNLFLNYKTAQTLGLSIDQSILAQAREVIR